MKAKQDLIVALDIGTSKVAALIAQINEKDDIELVGLGMANSIGMRKGVVVNIDEMISSVEAAVKDAELTSGLSIESALIGLSGTYINSVNSTGIIGIKDKEVTQADIDGVMDAARAIAIPSDQKIIHVLPQEFIIDKQGGIVDPIGMSGVRLEAYVHVITAAQSPVQNIVKCVERCDIDVEDIVIEPVASSIAVLEKDEKEIGVCMVDIGAGTTDIAIFSGGTLQHTTVLPVAGTQVTNDIAVAVGTSAHHAEALKISDGCALRTLIEEDEEIEVPGVGETQKARLVSRQTLASVIEPRYEELFNLIMQEIQHAGYSDRIGAGIVLTGGASTIKGAPELAEEIFHMPVRLGIPKAIANANSSAENPLNTPQHATGIGLLHFAKDNYFHASYGNRKQNTGGLWDRIKAMVSDNL